MKNKIVIGAGLALLVASLLFVSATYDQHHRSAVRQLQAQQAVVEENSRKVAVLTKEVTEDRDALLAQCRVGVDSWNKLTPAQQKTQAKPDCDLSFK